MLNPSIEVAEKNINALNLVNYFGKLEPLGHWLHAFLNDWNPDHQSKGNLDAIIHHLIFSTKET